MFDITNDNFVKEVEKSEIPVLVDFWAPWCGPCKLMGPVFEELSHEYAGKIEFAKLNVDDNQDIASKFGVSSIPTLIMFKKGHEVDRLVGFAPKPYMKAKIAELAKKAQ